PHGFLERKDVSQAIYCIWHNRLALCMKLYFAFGKHRSKAGMAGLVSASRDGAFLAAILERFGVQPVRGSSSRRGPQALLELTTLAEQGCDLAITPDGPRGPRYVVQEGAMSLAQITGLPIVPVSYRLQWKIQLKSWDGFQIPLPFSRCEIFGGRVFQMPREATDAEREELRRQLETELRAISKD
ncbi:MAG: lysophospholipid acyltransferase family protein, partial [Limisphaerales bacterium]